MDRSRVLDLARRHVPSAQEITAIFDLGTRALAYEIDETAILKIPKHPRAARALEIEKRALEMLEARGWAHAPRLLGSGVEPDGEYVMETRIPGVGLRTLGRPWPPGSVETIAEAVAELHALAIGEVDRVFPIPTLDAAGLWSEGSRHLLNRGLLTEGEMDRLSGRLEAFRTEFPDGRQALLHGDLWNGNCFVDPASGRFTGWIDFGDACLGPTAWDFGLVTAPPPGWPEELLDAYVGVTGWGEELRAEVEFYRLINTVSFLKRFEPQLADGAFQKFSGDIRRALAFYLAIDKG